VPCSVAASFVGAAVREGTPKRHAIGVHVCWLQPLIKSLSSTNHAENQAPYATRRSADNRLLLTNHPICL
jgi:hypothetical protein